MIDGTAVRVVEYPNALHAFDRRMVPIVVMDPFGNFGPSPFGGVIASDANRVGRLALSQAMMDSLGAFARTGNPNHAGFGVTRERWPRQ